MKRMVYTLTELVNKSNDVEDKVNGVNMDDFIDNYEDDEVNKSNNNNNSSKNNINKNNHDNDNDNDNDDMDVDSNDGNDNDNDNDDMDVDNNDGNDNDIKSNFEKSSITNSFKKDFPWKWMKCQIERSNTQPSVFDYIFPIYKHKKANHFTIPTEDEESEDIEEINF